eukprot:11208086-Lingulodinium_polyedra.AAC.1
MPIGAKSQEAQKQLLLDMLSAPRWTRAGSAQGQSSIFLRRWGADAWRPRPQACQQWGPGITMGSSAWRRDRGEVRHLGLIPQG